MSSEQYKEECPMDIGDLVRKVCDALEPWNEDDRAKIIRAACILLDINVEDLAP